MNRREFLKHLGTVPVVAAAPAITLSAVALATETKESIKEVREEPAIRLERTWQIDKYTTINEIGLMGGMNGEIVARHTFDNPLYLIPGDEVTYIIGEGVLLTRTIQS